MPNEIPLATLNATVPVNVRDMFEKPPQGVLAFTLNGLSAHMSEPQSSSQIPRLILAVDMIGTAPEQVAGLKWREDFWIGTEDDPTAAQPATWETECAQLAKFCDNVGFDCRGQRVVDIAGWLVDKSVLADCQHFYVKDRNRTGQPNPNAYFADGTRKSRATLRWLPPDSAVPQLYEDQTPKGGTSSAATAPTSPTASTPGPGAAPAPPPGFVAGPVPVATPLGMPALAAGPIVPGGAPPATGGPPTGFPGAAPAPAPAAAPPRPRR